MVKSTQTTRMMDVMYDHVKNIIISLGAETPAGLCMQQNRISTAYDIASFDDIGCLMYDVRDERAIIGTFLHQKHFECDIYLTEEMILDLKNEKWDQFCIRFPISSTMVSPAQKPMFNNTNSEFQKFIRGVKRDKSQYSEIKDERHFDNWGCSFLALPRDLIALKKCSILPTCQNPKMVYYSRRKLSLLILFMMLLLRPTWESCWSKSTRIHLMLKIFGLTSSQMHNHVARHR
jgi:hypothetical protein